MIDCRWLAVLAFVGSVSVPAVAADVTSKQIPARVELHPIQSLTLSDHQFLTGDSSAKQVTISGAFRIAQGDGRLPVVVLVHGSSGVISNIDVWEREFNALGISTFTIDGFTGRGLTIVGPNQALLGRLNLILDSYRVLNVLAKHPRVDPNRVALMGFSRGGQAALYASLKRFHQMWNNSGTQFAAYLPFYPDCMTTFISDADADARPIRIFHGSADDYDPVAPCKAYVQRLKAAGQDVTLTEYANAPHGFDFPLGPPLRVSNDSQTVRRCTIREEPMGLLINAVTKQPFTYADACVERNPHVGNDPAATAAAHKAVDEFLRTLFKLN